MTNFLIYLLQGSIVFTVLYFFYIIVLKHLTFYGANRVFLLTLIPVSLLIPLVNYILPDFTSSFVYIPVLQEVPVYKVQSIFVVKPDKIKVFDYGIVLGFIYVFGVVRCLVHNYLSINRLYLLKKKSKVIKEKALHLVFCDVAEVFSFLNAIYLPYDQKTESLIIEHEKAHIKLKHSYDLLLCELYIAFFWFNPLTPGYRRSLISNHEFQADAAVLRQNIKTSEYMALLLKVIDMKTSNRLFNYFTNSILKKRIIMMTKSRSNKFSKLTYLLLLPLCIFMLTAFTNPIMEELPFKDSFNFQKLSVSPPSLFPVKNADKNDITSFFREKRNHPKLKRNIIHTGIDIKANSGATVLASADGMVRKASYEGNWGNLIVISHDNGFETWYAHLKGFNITQNEVVKKGDIIGYVGNTGLSTGPHLHFEIKQNGKHVNPLDFIK